MPFSFRPLLRLLVAGLLLAAVAACDQEGPEPVASKTTIAQAAEPSPTATAVPDTPTPAPTPTNTPAPPTTTRTPPPEPTGTPQPTATATVPPEPTATPTPEPTTAAAGNFPVTVQSSDGREIVFERPPERIVAFDSAVVEILFAIGEGDRAPAPTISSRTHRRRNPSSESATRST